MIHIQNLKCEKGNFSLTIPELVIEKKDTVALVGHNGSGKTTFLNCLLGFEKYAGTISIMGCSSKKEFRSALPKISYCMQNPDDQLFCATVREDILFAPENFRLAKSPQAILDSVCQKVQISHLLERPPYELSYGEKKSCVLAVALATDPELLLLDEPFAMLDGKQKRVLRETMVQLPDKTLIMATHDFDSLRSLCRKALVFRQGRLEYFGDIGILEDNDFLQKMELV